MADLDVRQQNIQVVPAQQAGATSAVEKTQTIRLVGQSAIEGYNDCVDFTAASQTKSSQNATEKEIDNALRPLFNKYGANWDSIKQEGYKLFGKINHSCSNPVEKQITIKSENINKITTYIEELLKTLKENNQKITLENLLAVHDNVMISKTKDLFDDKEEVTLDSIKKSGLIGELAVVAGCSVSELKSKSEEEIQQIINTWNETYTSFAESGKSFTAKELRESANDAVLLDTAGITKADFEEMLANGEIKGLRELLGLKDGEAITSKKIADLLSRQNQEFKTRLEKITDPEERTEFIRTSVAKQKAMFALTLRATDRSDRREMIHAIKDLFTENRGESFKILLTSLDEDTRIELANTTKEAQLKEIILNPDVLGNYVSRDDAIGIKAEITEYSNAKAIQTRHEELLNDEDIQAVIAKVNAGEELTEDEQRIYNYLVDSQSGEIIGTANHNYYDPQSEEIQGLLGQMNSDAYSLPTYREVMGAISEYIEIHNENLPSNLADIINEATGGNYSTVVSDIQNGTTSELTPPSQTGGYITASPSNGSSSADLGFTVPEQPTNTVNPNQSKDRLYTQTAPVNTTPVDPTSTKEVPPQDIIAASKDTKTFSEFLKNNGTVTTVTEVFSNIGHITNQGILNRATLLYKGLKQMQDDVLMAVNNSGLAALLPHTSDSTLKSLEGQTFVNFDATRQVREACEKLEA